MLLSKPLARVKSIYGEYPPQFWILVLSVAIDRLGGGILYSFFGLYVTRRFGVGMTAVGLLLGVWSVTSLMGGVLGGALADRLGRRSMLVCGLVVSGLSSLLLGLVGRFEWFFLVSVLLGLVDVGGPAGQAMLADLLPEEKRAQGFGILRVGINLAATFGPAIGGLLASRSYLLLFIADAATSGITALIVLAALRETRPRTHEGQPEQTVAQTFAGYWQVARDTTFVMFVGACILMWLVYVQMYTTLAVYLRDTHGVSEQGIGTILSLNAGMVVLLQFPISRRAGRYRPLMLMAAGSVLYALGFGMYGFVASYGLFLAAMAVITIGEMIALPTAQALVTQFAPEDMRGRYLAFYDLTWVVPSAVGPLLAGLVMDRADPRWVWYVAGLVGLIAAGSFVLLQRRDRRRREKSHRCPEAVGSCESAP